MSQAPPPPPPPPPPSGGYPAPGGASAFSVGDAVSYGWTAYWKNVGPMVLIALTIVLVHVVLEVIGLISGNFFFQLILGLVAFVVGMVLAMGLIRASLAVVRGETPEVSMLFETAGIGAYIVAAILFGIMFFVGLALCIIPGIIVAILFMFYGFVIVENPNISPIEALKESMELTKGRIGELFVFVLALIGINIVGVLVCFVGLIFSYGITAIAVAYAYRTLRGEPVAAA